LQSGAQEPHSPGNNFQILFSRVVTRDYDLSVVLVAVVAAVPPGESVLLSEAVLAPVAVAAVVAVVAVVAVGIPRPPGAVVPETGNSQRFQVEDTLP
jgi:hypothetical protein